MKNEYGEETSKNMINYQKKIKLLIVMVEVAELEKEAVWEFVKYNIAPKTLFLPSTKNS